MADYFKETLQNNFVGFYLHGSMAMDGFNENSDIDFIVVVHEDFEKNVKREIIQALINFNNCGPRKGLEMSIITAETAKAAKEPLPFLLHYSKGLESSYLNDENYICSGDNDCDLLSHFMVINHHGETILGEPQSQVFAKVRAEDYIFGFMYDLNDIREKISPPYEYYILNLCRSYFYLKEGVVSSKLSGGKWACLNTDYSSLIEKAINNYLGGNLEIAEKEASKFKEAMFEKIDQLKK